MDTSSSYLILGLPLHLVAHSFRYNIFFEIAVSFILSIRPSDLILWHFFSKTPHSNFKKSRLFPLLSHKKSAEYLMKPNYAANFPEWLESVWFCLPFHHIADILIFSPYIYIYTVYIFIYIRMLNRTAELQTLHFKYLFNKYPYSIF
jgi:hypothetical protein